MTSWSYIVQRAVTGEFLEWDLPLVTDGPLFELSGPGSLSGTVEPDVGGLRTEDGRLVLEEWGSYIYAEADGEIRWGGIVVSSSFEDESWKVEVAGFTTYPHGIPYLGDFSRLALDPVDAVREIWRHVQSFPDANLGITVVGNPTPVRLGTPAVPAHTAYAPHSASTLAAPLSATATSLDIAGIDNFAQVPTPFSVYIDGERIMVGSVSGLTFSGLERGYSTSDPAAHAQGAAVVYPGNVAYPVEAVAAEPYVLAWYESPDCGSEIDDLAKATPFDFTERHYWTDDTREQIAHEVIIHWPRLGRKRDDLAFIQGENVTDVVHFGSGADHYANEVVGLGAGEGRATLRRSTAQRDGRLRRTSVYSDKAVTSATRMDAVIADELASRRGLLEVTEITVRDHPNAPLGSWSIGDDVLVSCTVPWLGDVDVWCRVTSWALEGEDSAHLTLARSDSFRYGG